MYDAGAIVTCTRSDPLTAGGNYPPISIPVLVSPGAQPGQLSNTAALQAPSDGNPDNDSFTDAGAVSEPAIDLHVEKEVTSTPNFTPVGYLHFLDPITYRITVTNNGVADAANVQLTDTFDAPLLADSITPSQGSCTGTVCNLGTITQGRSRHDRRTALDREQLRHLSVQRAAEQHRDRVGPGRHRDQPGRQQRLGRDLHSAVGRNLDHEDVRARAAGRGRPGHLHADRPQRRTRNGGLRSGRHPAGRRCRSPRRRSRSPAGPASVGTSRPARASAAARPGGLRSSFCDIPQLGPGEDRVITIHGTLAPDSAGTQVDNLALSSNTLPVAGVFSFEPDFTNNDDLVSFTPGTVDVGITKRGLVGPAVKRSMVGRRRDLPARRLEFRHGRRDERRGDRHAARRVGGRWTSPRAAWQPARTVYLRRSARSRPARRADDRPGARAPRSTSPSRR